MLGSAVACGYFDRLAAPLILEDDARSDVSVAESIVRGLGTAGLKLERDGEPISDPVQDVANHVSEFRTSRLPQWRSLGLVSRAPE